MKNSKISVTKINSTVPTFDFFVKRKLALLTTIFFNFILLGSITPSLADPNFRNNDNGTLTDKRTNLTWMRCAVGQAWNGKTCVGDKVYFLALDALKTKMSFAGYNDWRVPTIDELWSSLPYGGELFLNQPFSWVYWSSSTEVDANGFSTTYWVKTMQFGPKSTQSIRLWKGFDPNSPWRTNTRAAVRLVRGKSKWDYIDNKNGTVTDPKSGLMWQRCLIGQIWNRKACTGKAKTFTYKQIHAKPKLPSVYAGQKGWRLPTYNELNTLVRGDSGESDRDSNYYNLYFPTTSEHWYYWSSYYFSVTPREWNYEIIGYLALNNYIGSSYTIGAIFPSYFTKSTYFENRVIRLVNTTRKP